MTAIEYRKLDSEDAESFRALRIEAVTESPAAFHPDADELRARNLSEFTAQIAPSALQSVYGAFDDRRLVGIAGLRRDAMRKIRHRAIIWGVYTKASYRGQGIARELMRTIVDDAKSGGEITLLQLCVHSGNAAAKALYKSVGFEVYGLQRHAMLVAGNYVDEELMDLRIGELREPDRTSMSGISQSRRTTAPGSQTR